MKTLYLLRHAKSSWDAAAMSDFDRPLNERGRRTAPFVGEMMLKNGIAPDALVCSPAVRAAETAIAVRQAANLTAEIVFDRRIYEADLPTLLQIVAELDERSASAMLVGHNPGLENLLEFLTGDAPAMPTAGLATIVSDAATWREFILRKGSLRAFLRPKDELKKLAENPG